MAKTPTQQEADATNRKIYQQIEKLQQERLNNIQTQASQEIDTFFNTLPIKLKQYVSKEAPRKRFNFRNFIRYATLGVIILAAIVVLCFRVVKAKREWETEGKKDFLIYPIAEESLRVTILVMLIFALAYKILFKKQTIDWITSVGVVLSAL